MCKLYVIVILIHRMGVRNIVVHGGFKIQMANVQILVGKILHFIYLCYFKSVEVLVNCIGLTTFELNL